MDGATSDIHPFFIAVPDRFWRFAASSLLDMQEWIGAVREERRKALEQSLPRFTAPWAGERTEDCMVASCM